MDHDALRFLGLVIAWVAILLFWLGVQMADGWVQRNVYPPVHLWWRRLLASAREKLRPGKRRKGAADLGGTRRIGE